MIVVLKKNSMKPRGRSLNFMNLIYISNIYFFIHYYYYRCCCCCGGGGVQLRPVEEQLKQRVIGKRYCISRKGKSYKGSTSRSRFALCQMSRKKQEVVFPERASWENMFRLDESIFGVL